MFCAISDAVTAHETLAAGLQTPLRFGITDQHHIAGTRPRFRLTGYAGIAHAKQHAQARGSGAPTHMAQQA